MGLHMMRPRSDCFRPLGIGAWYGSHHDFFTWSLFRACEPNVLAWGWTSNPTDCRHHHGFDLCTQSGITVHPNTLPPSFAPK